MNNFYDVWFSYIDLSNNIKLKLLEKYSTKEIFDLSFECNKKIEDKILNSKKLNLEKYFNYLEKYNIKVISFKDERYPGVLNNIENKPAFLYIRGSLENLYSDNVAIVGSRNASEYGKNVARKISKELADKNINIVSGLALGIDKYAHLGALDSRLGKTIAVLGTGVSDYEVYPFQNKKIFERILENDGTIISELRLGTKPEKYNFPLRNRIISGISKKVIVVEATQNSGSLITANYALDQGKDIYAVPGNITSKNSVGTNKLIEEGAYIFKSIQDIFY